MFKMDNSITALKFSLVLLFSGALMTSNQRMYAQSKSSVQGGAMLDVTTFGATPNDNSDDLPGIQKCLDKAAATGATCFIPKGRYVVNGDLWLSSNTKLKGEGAGSLLVFQKGALRILKNGSRDFNYTSNYNNEIVPGEQLGALSSPASAGSSTIKASRAGWAKPGDLLYVYNNVKDSWTVLSDANQVTKWNDPSILMTRKELFIVKSVNGNAITLDRKLQFDYNAGSTIGKQVGASNITISDIGLENFVTTYTIMFEEPRNVTITNVAVNGAGGILLSHMAYKCVISNCNITTSKTRAILVENFSTENTISNNTVNYNTGGDAAVMLLMSSYNNNIYGNTVNGRGNAVSDEAGIYVHALSYNNAVYNNVVSGTAEGIGTYYGAFNNKFYGNKIRNVKIGIMSYYSRGNDFHNNDINILTARKGNSVGALVFGGLNTNVNQNTIKGKMSMGIQLQSSQSCRVAQNTIEGASADDYSFGIRVINDKTPRAFSNASNAKNVMSISSQAKSAASAGQQDASLNSIENNNIQKMKFNVTRE